MAAKKKKSQSRGNVGPNQQFAWVTFCLAICVAPLVASTGGNAFMEIYLPIIVLSFGFTYVWKNYQLHGQLKWSYSSHWLLWGINALLVWGLFSSLWSVNVYLTLDVWLRWLCAWLGLMIAVHLIAQKNNVNILYQGFAFVSLPIVLLGIGQYLFNIDWISQPAPPAATFKNKNIFSQYLVLVTPLIVALYLLEVKLLKQWLFGMIATLCLAMIVYAKTRGAWLAVGFQLLLMIAACLVITSLRPRNITSSRLVQLACFVAVFVVMIHMNHQGFNATAMADIGSEAQSIITEANTERENGSIRLVNWANTITMIKDNWLTGVGLGNWQVEYPLYKSSNIQDWLAVSNVVWQYAHNDYLEIVASLGIVGALILLVMLCGLLVLTAQLRAHPQPIIQLSALLALSGLGVTALFSFPLQLSHTIVFSMCLVGVLLSTLPKRSITIKGTALICSLVISFIMLLSVSYLGYAKYQARDSYRLAGKYLRRNDYHTMLIHANAAYQWTPWSKEVLEVKAIAESQLQQREQATQTYHHYLNLYPNTVTALENYTINLMHIGRYPEAMEGVQHLLKIEPNSVIGNVNMGTLLYHNKGNFKPQAVQFYQRVLQLEPNHPQREAIQQLINSASH